jgi:hypothetical protein
MPDKPTMINLEDTISENINDDSVEDYNSYGYNENITSKLGGNYSKIIEFYDSRL